MELNQNCVKRSNCYICEPHRYHSTTSSSSITSSSLRPKFQTYEGTTMENNQIVVNGLTVIYEQRYNPPISISLHKRGSLQKER
jgi:hypothetical protein